MENLAHTLSKRIHVSSSILCRATECVMYSCGTGRSFWMGYLDLQCGTYRINRGLLHFIKRSFPWCNRSYYESTMEVLEIYALSSHCMKCYSPFSRPANRLTQLRCRHFHTAMRWKHEAELQGFRCKHYPLNRWPNVTDAIEIEVLRTFCYMTYLWLGK